MIKKLKRVRFVDLLSIPKYISMILIRVPFNLYNYVKKRNLILICEDPNEATDNGYELYKYLRYEMKYPHVYYANDKRSPHLYKFDDDKNMIKFYSFKHWLYYVSAYKNISNHKASSPCPALFYVLQKYKIFNGNRVFLQHGVTMNYVDYLSQKECNFKYFITAALPEHEFIKKELGYTEDNLKLLGFSRFDRVYSSKLDTNNDKISILPTWRSYLENVKNDSFVNSSYFKNWNGLLNDKDFINMIEKNEIIVYFYLHRKLQKYSSLFYSKSRNIKICSVETHELTDLIDNSNTIITDYSSISIDFAYAMKNVLYFQFDQDDFSRHLRNGYFSYKKNGFGKISKNIDDTVLYVKDIIDNDFELTYFYKKRVNDFFKYIDDSNNKRICNLILPKEYYND